MVATYPREGAGFVAMSDLPPLAKRMRQARDAAQTTNRKIAVAVGVSSPTIDRLMNGEGRTSIETIDAVAQHLSVPLNEARKLASLPTTGREKYVGPDESVLLSDRQRNAIDELIRSLPIPQQQPVETVERLLDYLTPAQLREIAEKAEDLADELDGDRERVYDEATTYDDRQAFMEAMGFSPDDDDWWLDDIDALARTYGAIIHEWGYREQEFLEALRDMAGPRDRPTPESHYRAFYDWFRNRLKQQSDDSTMLDGAVRLSKVTLNSVETETTLPADEPRSSDELDLIPRTTGPTRAGDLTRNAQDTRTDLAFPPDLTQEDHDLVARPTPPGHTPGKSEQGEAGGEESQDQDA